MVLKGGRRGKYEMLIAVERDQIVEEYPHRDSNVNLVSLRGVVLMLVDL